MDSGPCVSHQLHGTVSQYVVKKQTGRYVTLIQQYYSLSTTALEKCLLILVIIILRINIILVMYVDIKKYFYCAVLANITSLFSVYYLLTTTSLTFPVWAKTRKNEKTFFYIYYYKYLQFNYKRHTVLHCGTTTGTSKNMQYLQGWLWCNVNYLPLILSPVTNLEKMLKKIPLIITRGRPCTTRGVGTIVWEPFPHSIFNYS